MLIFFCGGNLEYMETKKHMIMPYIVVCGSGIMNLILMSLPFINDHGSNISGYIIISYIDSTLQIFVAVFQILVMLLAFAMLFYGAVGILYSAGVTGIDMSDRKYRYLCALPIVIMNILYFIQFVLIAVTVIRSNTWMGIGVYMSFFLNIGITIMNVVLLKEPTHPITPPTSLPPQNPKDPKNLNKD